jgi:hypothetical protein
MTAIYHDFTIRRAAQVAMKPRYGTCPTSSSAEPRAALAQYTARDRDQVRLDSDEAVRQTLMRLGSAQMFLEGAPWRDFFPAGPAGRLTILKQCHAVSQKVNSLPQMINQQFRTDSQAAIMSPRHLDHFELRTEMPPRPAFLFGRVKSNRDLERCRKILRHCD